MIVECRGEVKLEGATPRIDAMDSCKLQNEQKIQKKSIANGLPATVTAMAILENAACNSTPHRPPI